MKVYLLSTYEEHGAKDVVGTTDPSKLPEMLKTFGPNFGGMEYELRQLESALKDGLADRDGWDLSDGWGGVMLHVIELQ